jgi:pimeloyl-ACP methyl ester carboxylesterase
LECENSILDLLYQPFRVYLYNMKAYFIPGLAADKRVFRHIQLPENFEAVFLEWLTPLESETLPQYAYRLAEQIDINQPYIIIGLSFGGMLAVEIAKKYPAGQLILIASIPSHHHLPAYYRTAYRIGLHNIIGVNLMKKAVFFKRYFTSESKEDRQMIREMARDMDPWFIKWAFKAIVNWKTDDQELVANHIHGTRDIILPLSFTKADYTISGAGHLMIFNKADEINRILDSLLNQSH